MQYLILEALPVIYPAHGIEDPALEYMFFSVVIGCAVAICLFYFQKRAEDRTTARVGERVRKAFSAMWRLLHLSL